MDSTPLPSEQIYREEGRMVGHAWATANPVAARQRNVAQQQAAEATRLHFTGLPSTHPDVAAYLQGWGVGVAQTLGEEAS